MSIVGKIDSGGFEQIILPRCGAQRENVVGGPAFGVDVSVVELPGKLGLAMTSDPLSLIPSLGLQESAWLSVHLMANDMATTGFAPMYAQMVLNLPPTLAADDFENYWNYIHKYCRQIGVSITGGHTGSIEGQNSTIAGGGTMLLTAPLDNIRLSRNAQPGNVIIVTKQCAMSSAAILAMSFPETVQHKVGAEIYRQGCELFYQTSSLTDGLTAAEGVGVTAMHDVTEGGVLGAIYEMAAASCIGVRVINELLPVGHAQQAICSLFNIDYRFCIGAGSMVIAATRESCDDVLLRLRVQNIDAAIVGEFTKPESGYLLVENEIAYPMPYYSKDPYWHAFFNAYKNGWN